MVLAVGLVLILAAQVVAPVAAPLFDSLTVLGPYHYLSPTGNQTGAPTSATVTEPLVNGTSPGFNAATTESPPQAQLIAAPDAFQLAPGRTSVTIRIEPVAPPAPSTVGPILGNVYRYTVTDQNGVALATKPGTDVTLVLRAPDATSEAVVAQYSGGAWTQITSSPSGTPAFFIGTAGTFGDFALVAGGSGIGPLQVSLLILLVGAVLGAIGFVVLRRRRRPGRRSARPRKPGPAQDADAGSTQPSQAQAPMTHPRHTQPTSQHGEHLMPASLRRVLVVAVAALLAGCAGQAARRVRPAPTSRGAAGDPIRIGAVFPISGNAASLALQELRGVQLAADFVNADGGIGGRRIVLDIRDLESGDAAPAAMASLRADGVSVVVGAYSSELSIPAAAAADRAGLVYWEAGAVADQLTGQGLPLVFRVGASSTNLGDNSADFAATQLAPRLGTTPAGLRVAIVAANDAYPQSVAAAAAQRPGQRQPRSSTSRPTT